MVLNPFIDPAFVWGMLFISDLVVGTLIFFVVLWDRLPKRFSAPLWALGWLYWAEALSLLTTALVGRSNPWGYHNVGSVTSILSTLLVSLLVLTYLLRPRDE